MKPNLSKGVLINEYSLVLQKVRKGAAGIYSCQVENDIGSGSSSGVQLNIKCKNHNSLKKLQSIMKIQSNLDFTSLKFTINLEFTLNWVQTDFYLLRSLNFTL